MSSRNYHMLEEIDLHEIFVVLKRHRYRILRMVILFAVIGATYAYTENPVFKGTASLQFNTRQQQIVDIQSVVSNLSQNEMVIKSEVDVLTSRNMIRRVYQRLNLAPGGGKLEFSDIDKEAIDEILENLSIKRVPKSFTVFVEYLSGSANDAAQLPNTLIDEYLASQREEKSSATVQANAWLDDKIKEMRDNVKRSEVAVQQFKEKYNLVEFNGNTVNDKQLLELNSQLTLAQTAKAQAEARLKQVRAASAGSLNVPDSQSAASRLESIPEVLSSTLIQELRVRESEVLQQRSDLSSRYGYRHPKIIKVNAELQDIRNSIRQEIKKIIEAIKNELEVARYKEKTLSENIGELRKEIEKNKRYEVELAELNREMESNITVYQAFLARYKETSQTDDQQNDARVLSYAEVPLSPVWPREKLIIAAAVLLGGFAGVILAFLKEYFDKGFRNTRQLTKVTGVSAAGMLPEIRTRGNIIDYAINNLTSIYAESLRTVFTHAQFSQAGKGAHSLLVTSALPKEGKSVFAISLARVLAKSGEKVLLVDGDMRLPTIHKHFALVPETTLVNYLMGEQSWQDAVYQDEATGLDLICATADTPHSRKLISSPAMEQFIREAREQYDYVIIDAPPVLAMADALLLAKLVDSSILLARWETTERSVTAAAADKFADSNLTLSSVVLSRVNLKKYNKYNYGDGGANYNDYMQYYSDI